MHVNSHPHRAGTSSPDVIPDTRADQRFCVAGNSGNPPGNPAKNPPETPGETRSLRSVAATNLRRGRHLRAVRDCGPGDQLDLFAAGCDQHGTPAGRRCALCFDQLDLFGPGPAGGDAA